MNPASNAANHTCFAEGAAAAVDSLRTLFPSPALQILLVTQVGQASGIPADGSVICVDRGDRGAIEAALQARPAGRRAA